MECDLLGLSDNSLLVVFGLSLAVNAAIVLTKKHHIGRSARSVDQIAVQSAHKAPTPRIGGVGIIFGVLVALLVVMQPQHGSVWWLFAVSLAPIFVAGLAEDTGFDISPTARLLAAAVSSVMCVVLLGLWVPRADIPGIDLLFAFAPFAIVFTVFAGSGICHAFNLIDGVNGLAAGTGVVGAVGLGIIASMSGEAGVAAVAWYLIAALLGFLVLNYPLGKIFLGDAGAYTVGHVLAWLSIVLLARVDSLSTWAILLVLFWPLADTVLAIYRRQRSGKPAGQPDRLHYHQLVMRTLEIALLGRGRRHIANPLTTMVILPLACLPMLAGVWLWDKPVAAFLVFLVFSMLFFGSYELGMRFANRLARRTKRAAQEAKNRTVVALGSKIAWLQGNANGHRPLPASGRASTRVAVVESHSPVDAR